LRKQQKKDGTYQAQTGVSNTTSAFKTVSEEQQGREEAVDAQLHIFSGDAADLAKAIVRLLCFVFQMSSRRQANAQINIHAQRTWFCINPL